MMLSGPAAYERLFLRFRRKISTGVVSASVPRRQGGKAQSGAWSRISSNALMQKEKDRQSGAGIRRIEC
jgi:hypothetical protein